MASYVKLGVCKTRIDSLDCDGALEATEPLWYCGLTTIEENPVLTEGLDLNDPGGVPNRDCVKIKIDPELDYFEIVLTTCSLFDTKIDALFGYSDEMVLTDGTSIGAMARKKQGENCICDCGEEACQRRVSIVTWSLALCPDGTRHPDGKFVVTAYPALQFRPNTFTRTTNRELNGRQYLAISNENPLWGQGPDDILPPEFANDPRCQYEYITDECPDDPCGCGSCGGDSATPAPEPGAAPRIARRAARRAAAAVTPAATREPAPAAAVAAPAPADAGAEETAKKNNKKK